MQILTVTIPLPPPILNLNMHIRHWSQRHRPMKAYKEAACLATLDAINRNPEFRRALPLGEIQIIPTMYFARAARRDKDNWGEAFKAVQDGIERAGVVLDDSTATTHPPELKVDRQKPRVELVIREIVIGSLACEPVEDLE